MSWLCPELPFHTCSTQHQIVRASRVLADWKYSFWWIWRGLGRGWVPTSWSTLSISTDNYLHISSIGLQWKSVECPFQMIRTFAFSHTAPPGDVQICSGCLCESRWPCVFTHDTTQIITFQRVVDGDNTVIRSYWAAAPQREGLKNYSSVL